MHLQLHLQKKGRKEEVHCCAPCVMHSRSLSFSSVDTSRQWSTNNVIIWEGVQFTFICTFNGERKEKRTRQLGNGDQRGKKKMMS